MAPLFLTEELQLTELEESQFWGFSDHSCREYIATYKLLGISLALSSEPKAAPKGFHMSNIQLALQYAEEFESVIAALDEASAQEIEAAP